MTPFLISGLPRSRTAWLSILFTHYPSFCLHEGLSKFGDVGSMVKAFSMSGVPVGDSDSGLTLFPDAVLSAAAAGQVRLAVIDRDAADVYVSLNEFYKGSPYSASDVMAKALPGHKAIMASPDALVVKFDDLSDETKVAELYQHLIPGLAFPAAWFHQLRLLQVNQILDLAIADQSAGRAA